MKMHAPVVALALLALNLLGCAARHVGTEHVLPEPTRIDIISRQTVLGFGYGQGIAHRDGLLYLYGDFRGQNASLDTPEDDYGCIREYTLAGLPDEPRVEWTGREIRLTRDGVNVAPHPTGLTFHPELGCFMGDTVNQEGLIFHLDFDRALADGNLNEAILNITLDDAAINGCRPEFVRHEGRWLIASSDYGNEQNEVRLYDPEVLARSTRVSRPGALVERFDASPFVQTLHWLDDDEQLVLVQNQTPGRRYRLTFTTLSGDLRRFAPIDIADLDDELEGLYVHEQGGERYVVMLSAYQEDNVTFGKIVSE